MPSSDSDDFESADEGHNTPDKKERRKRNSSSNYSDNALESEQSLKVSTSSPNSKINKPASVEKVETTDGWDDFEIDESETITLEPSKQNTKQSSTEHTVSELKTSTSKKIQEDVKSKDTGWDDFDDWGQGDFSSKQLPTDCSTRQVEPDRDIKEVTDRMAATSTNSSGWGWGWGVDSLLSSATAGFTTITNQVSQGISTVLESGIGAPDPEELAKQRTKVAENKPSTINNEAKAPIDKKQANEDVSDANDASFPFGSLLSGVTKFVETTGTKVIAGGLDTLETIGKKTMEVLQDGDPGLAKKRAMLGLDPGDKLVLSQVLREAKARADEEDRIREERREAKEVHYENLFDDFEGLVHLEALEMLSRQVNIRIEERMRTADPRKKQEIKETLQQVSELCEMPEEDDEPENSVDSQMSKCESLQERLQSATRDLGIKVQFQPLIKQYTEMIEWCSGGDCECPRTVYKRGVSSLAQATALAVEVYHKGAEMLLVKTRRSTADETDALTQMTVVLTKHISEIATLFTEKLNSISTDDKQQINTYITNIFLEAGNSSTYIQNAFQLALPILQIGAV